MADAPAPGEVPPGTYDTQVPALIGVISFLGVISTAAVAGRIYTRHFIVNKLGVDDYFAIFALLCLYATCICVGCMAIFGLGRHVWTVSPGDMLLYQRSFVISIIMYCLGVFAVKMTLLFQFYRGLATPKLKPLFIAAIILVGGWSAGQVLVGIFGCSPMAAAWDRSVEGHCMDFLRQYYINAAGNIITDVMVLLLPIFILVRLNLVLAQKLVLIGIFSIGFFSVALSFVRLKYLRVLDDVTWENIPAACWSMAEIASGIVCACLPTLRPLVSGYFPQLSPSAADHVDDSRDDYDKHDIITMAGRGIGDVENNSTASSRLRDEKAGPGGPYVTPAVWRAENRHLGRGEDSTEEGEDSSEEVIGLGSAREGLSSLGGPASLDDEGMLGLKATVRTQITPSRPQSAKRASSANSIQVQREVHQVKQERQSSKGSYASGSGSGSGTRA